MKKRVLSIVLFALLLFFGFIYLNKVFSTENHFNNTISVFNKLSKNTEIDIAIFGSSHAYTAFNPLIIDKECGTTSFNFGSDALRVPITGIVVNEVLKKTTPKLIILEIYATSIKNPNTKENKGYQLRALDMANFLSKDKFNITRRFYNNEEALGVYFPLFRNHQLWNKNKYFKLSREEKINKANTFFYNGYLGKNRTISEKEKKSFEDFLFKKEYSKSNTTFIDSQGEKDIIDLIKTSKSQGSDVLVLSSPDLRAKYFWTQNFLDKLNKICQDHGANYLNLNEFYNEMNLKVTDFKDPSHLNIQGAYKTSLFLSEYLKKEYNFHNNNTTNDTIFNNFMKSYINVSEYYYTKKTNKSFTENVVLDSISIQKKGFALNFTLVLDSIKSYKKDFKKYKLLVKVFPNSNNMDQLDIKSIKKGLGYDKIDIPLDNNISPLSFNILTKIDKIKKIEMFLYDKDKYNGPVGDKIVLKNIIFN